VRAPWLEARDESVAARVTLSPLTACSWLYGAGAWLARAAAEHGVRPRRRLPGAVVSVGNLLVGGTGKTPFAAWLARSLHARGHKVALASRGYGRSGREPVEVVSDGRHVRGSAERVGDEPVWLAGRAPGVPVLVGRDRGLVGLRALSGFGAELLVLDDGFQHHRLARDVDFVCFDGGFGLGNGHLLPRGPLREPLSALRRADALVCLEGPLPAGDEARVRAAAPSATWFSVRRRPASLRPLAGGAAEAPERLRGAGVGVLSGIARPQRLRRSLEALGAHVVAERAFPDHHRFTPRDVAGLGAEAPLWVTTEKDAVKLVSGWCAGADVRVLAEDLAVDEPDALLDWLEMRLRQRRQERA
jgi:tetraacyldisaccharide 4'-kinase